MLTASLTVTEKDPGAHPRMLSRPNQIHTLLAVSLIVPDNKIALFIDVANLYATAKALGLDIDYK
jgi:hypothetical protein